MKKVFLLLSVLIASYTAAQTEEELVYFPQEQLIHPECANTDDKNNCLKVLLEQQIFTLLMEKKNLKAISKSEKDTLSIQFTLLTTEKGIINKELSNSSIRYSKKYKKIDQGLNQILNRLPKFEVLNRRSQDIKSKHYLNFKYRVERDKKAIKLNLIKNKNTYTGGVIENIPKISGCGNKDNLEDRRCFNKKIQNHIAQNFQYPISAQKKGLQGRVSVIFTIQKDGSISNIRKRGPHAILEQEAVRIIKLLPQLEPGMQNGKPVRVPFSIPITFKLN